MSEVEITREVHEKLAMSLFNATWDLLGREDRTEKDDIEMIHSAHASRHHWGQIGEPLQFERGEWQISRVYSVLGRSEPTLYHARLCLEICRENDIGDFDIAFAYEAMARAYAVPTPWREIGRTTRSTVNWRRRPAGRSMKRETGTTSSAS